MTWDEVFGDKMELNWGQNIVYHMKIKSFESNFEWIFATLILSNVIYFNPIIEQILYAVLWEKKIKQKISAKLIKTVVKKNVRNHSLSF